MTNAYDETQQQQEMLFSRDGDSGGKQGFQGDGNSMRIWVDSDGLFHIAEDCCLQIIFFILYSSSPLLQEKRQCTNMSDYKIP